MSPSTELPPIIDSVSEAPQPPLPVDLATESADHDDSSADETPFIPDFMGVILEQEEKAEQANVILEQEEKARQANVLLEQAERARQVSVLLEQEKRAEQARLAQLQIDAKQPEHGNENKPALHIAHRLQSTPPKKSITKSASRATPQRHLQSTPAKKSSTKSASRATPKARKAPRVNSFVRALLDLVVHHSHADTWDEARREWRISPAEFSAHGSHCLCGHKIKHVYNATNRQTGGHLTFGCVCVLHFAAEN